MSQKFKAGQVVRCIENHGNPIFILNDLYIVENVSISPHKSEYIKVRHLKTNIIIRRNSGYPERVDHWLAGRFEAL